MSAEREQRLLALFARLDISQQDSLLEFASSLAARDVPSGAAAARPCPGPRPADESVALAIRRLTRGYPMLDRRKLMGPASALLAQHALQGRAAAEVIDELEQVFERQYREAVPHEG